MRASTMLAPLSTRRYGVGIQHYLSINVIIEAKAQSVVRACDPRSDCRSLRMAVGAPPSRGMAKTRNLHVVPGQSGWVVRKEGSARSARRFSTKGDAVTYARDTSKRDKGELYVHNRDGTISERNSYGVDPVPSKDKKR